MGFGSPLELPWTMSFLIRKRQQVDNLNEMPKDKRPTERMIWWGTPEEIEEWMDKVYDYGDKKKDDDITFVINDNEIG